MEYVLWGIGAVLALVAVGLLWYRHTITNEIALMASMQATGAGDAGKAAPGSQIEVKGTLRVREPLIAEFSKKPSAYYKCEIEREDVYYERNSKGESERRTRTTTVYTNTQYGQCLIEDTSGRVGVDFDGANVEAVETVNEPTSAPGSTGTGSAIVSGVLSMLQNSSSTYTRKEWMLAPDAAVYVLGEMHEGGLIGKPVKGSHNKVFVISYKSKEERTKSLTSTTRWQLVGSIVMLVIAAGLIVWAFKVKA